MHFWNGITERLRNDPINRTEYFLLRCLAYFILQPLIIGKKGEISPAASLRMKKYLSAMDDCSAKGRKLFREIVIDCSSCSKNCCKGGFDRFTVYDHITDVIRNDKECRPWSFRLSLFKPKKANITRMDEDCLYLGQTGCILSYEDRPTRCIYEDCWQIRRNITRDQKKLLAEIRHTFNRIQFMYAAHIIAGGIRFPRNGPHAQDTYVNRRRTVSSYSVDDNESVLSV